MKRGSKNPGDPVRTRITAEVWERIDRPLVEAIIYKLNAETRNLSKAVQEEVEREVHRQVFRPLESSVRNELGTV